MPRLRSTSRPRREDVRRPAELPPGAGDTLLPIARAAIAREFGVRPVADESPEWLQAPGASFVTLTTAGELHGCIGSTTPRRSLLVDVQGNAVAAAFHDRRFPPLTTSDLDRTVIEVSVLSPTTPLTCTDEADALAQLRAGVDGVVLEFAGRRATYLPQVWEKLPDPEAFLAHLKVKLGLPPYFWGKDLTLARYTVTAFGEEEGP